MLLNRFFIFIILIFIGCGYKPTSNFMPKDFKKVYISLSVDIKNPIYSVFVKDKVIDIFISRFHSQIVKDKSLADTIINIKLNSISLTSIGQDEMGYANLYKAVVKISLSYKNKITSKNGSFSLVGNYTFSIDSDSVISNNQKILALEIASSKALEELISKFALMSI